MGRQWKLIDNDAHNVFTFSSEQEMRDFAREKGWEIKRSPHGGKNFYVESVGMVPGNS